MLIGGGTKCSHQAFIQLIEMFDLQLGAALAMLLVIPALVAFCCSIGSQTAVRMSPLQAARDRLYSQAARAIKWPFML